MQIVAWPGVCVLEVPNRWSWETNDRVISIFRPDGSGAVQLEMVRETRAEDLIAAELLLLPGGAEAKPVSSELRVGGGRALSVTHEGAGKRWAIWAVEGRGRGVKLVWFAPEVEGTERAQVDALIASFRWQ